MSGSNPSPATLQPWDPREVPNDPLYPNIPVRNSGDNEGTASWCHREDEMTILHS